MKDLARSIFAGLVALTVVVGLFHAGHSTAAATIGALFFVWLAL